VPFVLKSESITLLEPSGITGKIMFQSSTPGEEKYFSLIHIVYISTGSQPISCAKNTAGGGGGGGVEA